MNKCIIAKEYKQIQMTEKYNMYVVGKRLISQILKRPYKSLGQRPRNLQENKYMQPESRKKAHQ